jgi:hypothetical protein
MVAPRPETIRTGLLSLRQPPCEYRSPSVPPARKSPGFLRFPGLTSGLPVGAVGRNRLSLPHFSPDLWTAPMQYGSQKSRISAPFRGVRRGMDSHSFRVPSARERNPPLISLALFPKRDTWSEQCGLASQFGPGLIQAATPGIRPRQHVGLPCRTGARRG